MDVVDGGRGRRKSLKERLDGEEATHGEVLGVATFHGSGE